jgi:hypothetical protein
VGGVHFIEFDAAQQDPGAAKRLEPQHGAGAPLDRPMVLLDQVIEIFGLADPDGCFAIGIDGFERDEVGTAFVDGHRLGQAILSDRLFKVTSGCSLVPMGAQQKVDGVAVLVDGGYLLSNLSNAVPMSKYGEALTESLQATLQRVRSEMNWIKRFCTRDRSCVQTDAQYGGGLRYGSRVADRLWVPGRERTPISFVDCPLTGIGVAVEQRRLFPGWELLT